MFKVVVAMLVGLVGAAIVHIAVLFAMPVVASNNSWGRLARLGGMFDLVQIEPQLAPGPAGGSLPAGSVRHEFGFVDPSFLTASCRFSLEDGPVRLSSPAPSAFWSASIYSRRGDNLYSINDRSAVNGRFNLLVGTAEQLQDARAASPDPAETTIPVELAETYGALTVRVLVDEASMRPEADAFLRAMSCRTETAPQASGDLPKAG